MKARLRAHRSEAGDTLVELLIALTVIGLTAVALLGGFATSITASAEHRSLASLDTVLKSFIETATYQLQLQPQPPTQLPQFTACATPSTYASLTLTQGAYTASITTVQFWASNNTWQPSCTPPVSGAPEPQLLTAQVTGAGGTESLGFVVTDPVYVPATPTTPVFTSQNSVTELSGSQFTFAVTSTGAPVPALSATTALPAGVTFVDNGGGNGTLAGTNSVSGGTYPITFTSSNSVGTKTQTFTLQVNAAPTITSANSDTVAPDTPFTFTVKTTGTPAPALTAAPSPLPDPGLRFVDNHDGTGTLQGTGSVVSNMTYNLTFTATNSIGTYSQPFTLVVSAAAAPVFTSANNDTVTPKSAFTFTVQTTGAPTPMLSASGLPGGVNFKDNGDGSGTLSSNGLNNPSMTTPITYPFTFTAKNAVSPLGVTQTFTLTVNPLSNPQITSPTQAQPEHGILNMATTFTVTGSGFLNGLTVTGGGSAHVNSFTFLNSSQISVTVTGSGGNGSTGDLMVKNPDGQPAQCTKCFVNG